MSLRIYSKRVIIGTYIVVEVLFGLALFLPIIGPEVRLGAPSAAAAIVYVVQCLIVGLVCMPRAGQSE